MLWMLWGLPFLFMVLGAGMITGVGNRHIILSDWSDSSGDFCSDLLVMEDR